MWQSADAAVSEAVVRELKKELGAEAVKEVRMKPTFFDSELCSGLSKCPILMSIDRAVIVVRGGWQALNCSADSFYSSQGRRDELFHDSSEGAR